MISKEEIEDRAAEFEVHTSNVQRDYVFGWLLVGVYTDPELAELLFLKGGNALRKGYFERTRYSSDLDFGTEGDIDRTFLEEKVAALCDFITEQAGVRFETERNTVQEKFRAGVAGQRWQVFEVRIYFKDFYGNADHITIKIQLDITRFDKLYLPVQSRQLIHPYSDVADTRVEVRCAKLEEILATKLKCLLQRQHTPDLYDYVYGIFVRGDLDVDRSEIISAFLKRTIFERSPGVVRGLLLGLPLEALRHHWGAVVSPRESRLPFAEALTRFREGIEDLFGDFADGGYRDRGAFFPAEFRNPIMVAGRNRTLLRLTYGGHARHVEPYALYYKQASGQRPREYFYAYDRTGGSSGVASIKSFVADGVQRIEETDTKFEPRYTIELAKAGEPAPRSHFGRGFSSRRKPSESGARGRARRARRPSRPGLKYVVECPYCGKRFKRKKSGTRLNKHKDKYGNQCVARSGYLVDTVYE